MCDKIPAVLAGKVVLQIRVIIVYAGVNNSNIHVLRPCAETPSVRGVYRFHSPQAVIIGVIGDLGKVERVYTVERGGYDIGIVPDFTQEGVFVLRV